MIDAWSLIGRIVPSPVVVAESFGDASAVTIHPEEYAVVERAVESRRREFVTARACAHRALAGLGVRPSPVLSGPRGCPLWPSGVVGSITHCDGYRAAAVALASDASSIGIDAEPNEALPDDGMLDIIACREERARLDDFAGVMPGICWDRLLFSAKESVYKAWFPLTWQWLGFEQADVVFDPVYGTFGVRLLVPGPVVNGAPLTWMAGRWVARQGLLLTSVVVPV